jgi:hypothetical protein
VELLLAGFGVSRDDRSWATVAIIRDVLYVRGEKRVDIGLVNEKTTVGMCGG